MGRLRIDGESAVQSADSCFVEDRRRAARGERGCSFFDGMRFAQDSHILVGARDFLRCLERKPVCAAAHARRTMQRRPISFTYSSSCRVDETKERCDAFAYRTVGHFCRSVRAPTGSKNSGGA